MATSIARRSSGSAPGTLAPWAMLALRTVSFLAFQVIIAVVLGVAGSASPWAASAAWWPVTATLTNVVCIVLLRGLLHGEGKRYRDLWRVDRGTLGSDLLLVLAWLVVSAPLVLLPNYGLGTWLFGDAAVPAGLFFQPLPPLVAYGCLVLFPLTIAMAELPTYFGYAMPRLAARMRAPWLAVVAASSALAIQHAALPLRFDAPFIVWRLLMYAPFAFFIGAVLRWRPRLLPYMMVVHGLLDLSAAYLVVAAS